MCSQPSWEELPICTYISRALLLSPSSYLCTMPSKKSWKECIRYIIFLSPFRRVVDSAHRHLTPAWHTVIMGTGATSALIHNFPYGNGNPFIRIFTLVIFFLNLVLFILISVATAARYALFPDVWSKMLRHPAQSLFVGAIPMGFATLINIALVSDTRLGTPSRIQLAQDMNQETGIGGLGFLYFLWGCWWVDSIVSVLCAFGMVYTMYVDHSHLCVFL